MSVPCDYGPEFAVWYVAAVGEAPVLTRSRFACDRHRGTAEAVVSHGGREITVSGVVDAPSTADEAALTTPERFEAFHEANPHVYRVLVRLAREWIHRTGRRKVGIAILWERMRWELAIQTNEAPKLNNDYRAYYARLIMRDEADLADLFDLRRSAADEVLAVAA